jgi:hypothetical protein
MEDSSEKERFKCNIEIITYNKGSIIKKAKIIITILTN